MYATYETGKKVLHLKLNELCYVWLVSLMTAQMIRKEKF